MAERLHTGSEYQVVNINRTDAALKWAFHQPPKPQSFLLTSTVGNIFLASSLQGWATLCVYYSHPFPPLLPSLLPIPRPLQTNKIKMPASTELISCSFPLCPGLYFHMHKKILWSIFINQKAISTPRRPWPESDITVWVSFLKIASSLLIQQSWAAGLAPSVNCLLWSLLEVSSILLSSVSA